MQKRAMVGFILVFTGLILITVSLAMPWYKIEIKTSGMGVSISSDIEFYLDHVESETMGMTSETSYDNKTLNEMNYVQTFKTTQNLAFIGIIGCVIGLIGAAMVMFEKIGSKFGTLLVLLAVILSIIIPFYLMFALPIAFSEDTREEPGGNIVSDNMGKSFFGSDEMESSNGSSEITWGGSTGWFLSIIVMIMCIVALILVAISSPVPKSIYARRTIPSDLFMEPSVQKTNRREAWADIEHEEPKQVQSFQIFQPVTSGQSTRFKCPECGKILIVSVPKRPLQVNCHSCGLKGTVL